MKEEQENIGYSQLIINYLSGETNDAEVQRLEEWVLSAPENKTQFTQLKKAWVLSNIEGNPQQISVQEEWQKTANQLFSKDEATIIDLPSKVRNRKLIGIAAAIALLIFAASYLLNPSQETDYQIVKTENALKTKVLPDGSSIAINQYSSIEYISDFSETRRHVALSGDAFFEVKRDTTRPFIITANDIQIEVLGTAFYVDSRDKEPRVEVIVQSGLVAVSAAGEKIMLRKGETGIYEKGSKKLFKKINEDINYLAWTSDTLVFDSVSLETVVHTLNRQFHVQISLENPKMKNCVLVTTFTDESLDVIIEVIEFTLGIKAIRNGTEIIFEGNGCD